MSVTVKALFSSSLDPSVVKQVFLDKTLNSSFHWLAATYQLTDVRVTGARWGGWCLGSTQWWVRAVGWGFSVAVEWAEVWEGRGVLSGGLCDDPWPHSTCSRENDYLTCKAFQPHGKGILSCFLRPSSYEVTHGLIDRLIHSFIHSINTS